MITIVRKWKHDPISFVRDNFKVEPDEWQADALIAAAKNQRLAMKASKGVGKTTILAWIAWWFMATRTHPKIAATSISSDNLADGLWAEMSKWQQKSQFLQDQFEWTKTRIFCRDFPETWFMSARAWSKSATSEQQAHTLAGLHADNIMFILDESGGIPSSVMAAAEAALANDMGADTDAKLIQAGNPTHLSGPLYEASVRNRNLWHVIEISSDPDNPKRSPRVSIEWAKQQIEQYGRDNPWVLVNVFGQFPPSSLNQLIGIDDVQKAMNRKVDSSNYEFSQKRLGVDCARFGDDSSIIFPRQGLMTFKYVEMRNARSNEIASRVIQAKNKWGSEVEYIDGTGGFGSGVVDFMIQKGFAPQEINFSSKANDHKKYFNKRAEMWFRMTEWIKRGGSLPKDQKLLAELTAPEYYFNGNRLILEEKEAVKEKIGSSPDVADALALTFSDDERTTSHGEYGVFERAQERSRSSVDYDPLDPDRF